MSMSHLASAPALAGRALPCRARSTATQPRTPVLTTARYGRDSLGGGARGPPGGNRGGSGQGQLIMPGGGAPSRGGGGSGWGSQQGGNMNPGGIQSPPPIQPGGRIIIPGQENQGQGSIQGVEGASKPLAGSQFRPPPGFMAEDAATDGPAAILKDLTTDQMISNLTTQCKPWYELGLYFPKLLPEGIDAGIVSELAGIEAAEQNRMLVAANIYWALKAAGELLPAEKLAHFERAGGDALLYELRFLDLEQRAAAASYLVDERLDERMALVVARAIKEWGRRPQQREGFENTPADCLAFKYYRDALECSAGATQQADKYVQQGLAVAGSETARAKLTSALSTTPAEEDTSMDDVAELPVVRMQPEELNFRPIAVVGVLGECGPAELANAPQSAVGGLFSSFTLPPGAAPAGGWISLPSWSLLPSSNNPAALQVRDCAQVSPIMATSGARTDEQKRRLAGVGILVVDTVVGAVEPQHYYLVQGASGYGMDLVPGSRVGDSSVCARVLFVVRPPKREIINPDAIASFQ